jgi:hypothetical protein
VTTYEAPKLKVLGTISELTLASGCKQVAVNSDGTFLRHPKRPLNACTS